MLVSLNYLHRNSLKCLSYHTSKYINTYPRADVGELIGVYVVPGLTEGLHSRRQVLHNSVACERTRSTEDQQKNTPGVCTFQAVLHFLPQSPEQPEHRHLVKPYQGTKTMWVK
jgi:hypothetical protein